MQPLSLLHCDEHEAIEEPPLPPLPPEPVSVPVPVPPVDSSEGQSKAIDLVQSKARLKGRTPNKIAVLENNIFTRTRCQKCFSFKKTREWTVEWIFF